MKILLIINFLSLSLLAMTAYCLDQRTIQVVCSGSSQLFDIHSFPFLRLKYTHGTNPRDEYGWPIRGGTVDKGMYFLNCKRPQEICSKSSYVSKKINDLLPASLFLEEYSPSYAMGTPEDRWYLSCDLRELTAINPSTINELFKTLGFKQEIESKGRGLCILADSHFPQLVKIKRLITPAKVYDNIMNLPERLLIRVKEYVTSAYYYYTGYEQYIPPAELKKWKRPPYQNKQVREWVECNDLKNKLFLDTNKEHETFTILNDNNPSIWNTLAPLVKRSPKNYTMISHLYAYLKVISMWTALRTIADIAQNYCACGGVESSKIP